MAEVIRQSPAGLSTAEAQTRLALYGPNDVAATKRGRAKKLLAPLYSPISLMLLGAALLSRLNGKVFDFYFIIALYAVNYVIQKWQEFKADRAIDELQQRLAFDVSTFRDGVWGSVNAKRLVPGDHIRLGLGSIIPADGTVISSKNLSVNEAVLTGESMPKEKSTGDTIYSGSFITAGSLEAEITATGKNTSFGKTIFSIEQPAGKSLLEKDILSITHFLTTVSLVAVTILTIAFVAKGFPLNDLITLDLSLIIAGIPVALPAVMTIVLSIGAAGLAKKLVIVRRLSALQDLANVNLLLTDKTGTLTKNEIKVARIVSYREKFDAGDIMRLARVATAPETPDAIDTAVITKANEVGTHRTVAEMLDFTPYDPERKRATSFVRQDGETLLVSMGAPQVIRQLGTLESEIASEKFERDIAEAAAQGFRALAIATKEAAGSEEKDMTVVGMLFLADPLDDSAKDTVRFMNANGIRVKMLTGDNRVITARVAEELGLSGPILAAQEARSLYENAVMLPPEIDDSAAFAEILPRDKFEIVKAFKTRYVVAATGDGINDLPALKIANVGIAVSGAVSALKSLADIVLLGPGLSVIESAILESRKIFMRLYNYSVYRISESFRLVITILVLGLGYGSYPLLPLQLFLLAFLNDIPTISLAFDRVTVSALPSATKAKERLWLSILFGSVGIVNSLLLFFLTINILHLPLPIVQTMFFLKLTVSGHALIYVAHTKKRWFKFLPSKEVIIATTVTQIIATVIAVTGTFMPAPISLAAALLIWVWALFWMQVSELMKDLQAKLGAAK